MNCNRREQRPENRSRVIFAISKAFGAARLGEHDVSRCHESGLLVKRSGAEFFQLAAGTLSQPTGADNLGSNVMWAPSAGRGLPALPVSTRKASGVGRVTPCAPLIFANPLAR